MKKILTIFAIACVALVFAGCQKDGVYNPSKKISKIYYTSTSGVKSLKQIWTWNGKLLDKIDYYNDGTVSYTNNFTYDGKRLTRMDCYKYNEYIEYKYDGSHLSEANVFYAGSLEYIFKFTYKSGKLESMTRTSTGKGTRTEMKIDPLTFVFGPEISQSIERAQKILAAKNNGKSTYIETLKFTWENGEISQCVTSFQGEGYYEEVTAKITYDKKKNPFSGALINFDFEDNMGDGSYSKHNIAKMDCTEMEDGEVENWTVTYNYSYDKSNYPISKRETETSGGYTYTGGLYEYEYAK
ncbi:MAG: hypothetical protein MJZ72_06650 [Bacteroidales bacterium]|nr:hypothetical protein [Bacteroidales bacterium]